MFTTCISKIGSVETIEIVLNFDQKDWFDFADECSVLADLLEDRISTDDWYFVPSFDIEPANLRQWKFDSLIVLLLKKKYG